ncbi:hypothetical protein AYK24_00370 [Thermoplasmatales archaeon SG8-52-4]|nr:MAG: hypothetical protein AYK24_00370 [Thermoplasmatales archaeon SG8-52-4]
MAKVAGDTYIALVLDGSGSMSADIETTITGVNEIIDLMRAEKARLAGKVKVSLVLFRNREGEVVYFNEDARVAKHLDHQNYVPSGSIPMYDGIGQAIKLIDGVIKDDDAALVYIFTDGWENSSSIFSRDEINNMILEREEKGNWTFVFQGIEGLEDKQELNFVTNNTFSYTSSNAGRAEAYAATAEGFAKYFDARRSGITQLNNFYDPNTPDIIINKKDEE